MGALKSWGTVFKYKKFLSTTGRVEFTFSPVASMSPIKC